jgi:hypothetical protein
VNWDALGAVAEIVGALGVARLEVTTKQAPDWLHEAGCLKILAL